MAFASKLSRNAAASVRNVSVDYAFQLECSYRSRTERDPSDPSNASNIPICETPLRASLSMCTSCGALRIISNHPKASYAYPRDMNQNMRLRIIVCSVECCRCERDRQAAHRAGSWPRGCRCARRARARRRSAARPARTAVRRRRRQRCA